MLSVGLLVTAVAGLLVTAVAADAQLPREVTLATNPPGTSYYAVASGLAKVVSGAAWFQMVVQPYTGTSTMLPLLNTGEVDFGQNGYWQEGIKYSAFGEQWEFIPDLGQTFADSGGAAATPSPTLRT